MTFRAVVLFFSFLPILLFGCRGDKQGPSRYSVRGIITLDDKPLESGSILFVDPAGQIQSYFATIKNGSYQTDVEAGTWNVQITAIRASKDKQEPNAEGTGMVPASEQYIPKKYNEKTELHIDVKPGGKNQFPFQLSSR